ncbi:MAG: hypothetical protein N2F24_15110, partial [Deltaproteobacteria bacterium]
KVFPNALLLLWPWRDHGISTHRMCPLASNFASERSRSAVSVPHRVFRRSKASSDDSIAYYRV